MATNYPFKNSFLAQLTSVNIRSRDFPNALTKVLASQEGVDTALSLRGDDALTLVDILDQAFEAPNMSLDLRRRSVRILRRVCGMQTILPRSCILSDNIAREGDIAFASGGFADVWKGRHNGNPVCIKAFRAYAPDNLTKIKKRLFQEIVIWRRLSHPNVLPVLGISPKLFPLCIVSEWMVDGNILQFTTQRPEVNRLRLLAEAASGLQYLHSMDIVHSDLKPTNIVIDSNFHARLIDYGLIAIISDPTTVDPGSTTSPSVGTVRYMAPELLNPSGFNLDNSNPTKMSDVYAFGMVTYQVTTGLQPFAGAKDGVIIYNVVTGERPTRPPGANNWVSDDVWNFISRCWSPSRDGRPDVEFAINALNDAADSVKSYVANGNGQVKKAARRGSANGSYPPSRDVSRRGVGGITIQQVMQDSPPASTPSPFVIETPMAQQKERRKQHSRDFRIWHDTEGLHQQNAALADYKDGVVHLCTADGTFFEIPEERISRQDVDYLRSQDVYKKAFRKGSKDTDDSKRPGFFRRVMNRLRRR
ncbi:kinase-like domain-containing protein [Thelephora terrestris]|uniref:Kinase-like domain-containing protein n=1 Tax=Thelephora terrestris TaxID=56493 RepID=A0A9P6HAP5_9AGAM|nr:kinase-like domain-containing protein [Thelephora terrestris]